jgi:hypothetical protein
VGHFRVELHAVETLAASSAMAAIGQLGVLAMVVKPSGSVGDLVAVAHPHIQQGVPLSQQWIFDVAKKRVLPTRIFTWA